MMKKLFTLFLLWATSLTVHIAGAYDFMEGGIAYLINSDGLTVTVTHENSPYFDESSLSYNPTYPNANGNLTIPAMVKHNGIPYTITAIGDYAFAGCSGFGDTLTIPRTITAIGDEAFAGCSGFTAINNHIGHPADVQLGDHVFYGISTSHCILYVPAGSEQEYRNAPQWKAFSQITGKEWGSGTHGDVSGDGKVDVTDVNMVINIILGQATSYELRATSDVNGDGKTDVSDVNEIINIILKLPAIERAIIVSDETIAFTGKAGNSYTKSLTIGSDNLHMAVSAQVLGGDGVFTVSPTTLPLEQVQQGAELTITYTPQSAGTHVGRLVLTSDGAHAVTVILTGTSTAGATATYTVNGVSFKMVYVEGGTFTMGATAEQGTSDPYENEYPTHRVTLSSYNIGETEVTQALWQAVMGSNPSVHTGNLQRPVECVSWDDCQQFITRLNELTGQTFRLPTEAEWEFAARGGNKSQGYKYAGSNSIDKVAWYCYNIPNNSGAQAVATKAPNELGLYDMSGNVSEWCQDSYGSYEGYDQTDPIGPDWGYYNVVRGGCWFFYAKNCRVSYRMNGSPLIAADTLGFRLAQ